MTIVRTSNPADNSFPIFFIIFVLENEHKLNKNNVNLKSIFVTRKLFSQLVRKRLERNCGLRSILKGTKLGEIVDGQRENRCAYKRKID